MTPIDHALLMARRVHQDQVRPGTRVPYLAHVLGVAALAFEYGATEEEAIAALLHDTVEDGGGEAMLAEIRAQFGETVADIVLGCSDSLAEDPSRKVDWTARKEAVLMQMESAPASVCLVKAAGQLQEARAIARDHRTRGDTIWTHFTGGKEGTLWFLDGMAAVLWRRWPSALTRDLRREVEALLAEVD